MLIFSFICSIIFSIVMITFIIASIYYSFNRKRLKDEYYKFNEECEDLINGFKTFDLNQDLGGVDDNKKE